MEDEQQYIVLFIARASSTQGGARAETKEILSKSLEYTRDAYVHHYGPLNPVDQVPFLTFVQSSNKAFRPDGDALRTIQAVLNRGRETKRPVMLVVNGWDGLSTNSVAISNLFAPYVNEVRIMMRMFVDNPRVFRQVSVKHAVEVLRGEVEGELEDLELPYHTKEFLAKIQAISAIKMMMALDFQVLRSETANRNRIPDTNVGKWVCDEPGCDYRTETSKKLCDHKHKTHLSKEKPAFVCPHCKFSFTREDHMKRHVKEATCKENPNHVDKPVTKRAPRNSRPAPARLEKAVSSDGSYPSYHEIQQNTRRFPRVNHAAPFDERTVYKDELFCRFPGCVHPTRFSCPAKLRTHYETIHKFQYPSQAPGLPNKAKRRWEEDGLDYLARCAHFGCDQVDRVGEQPMRSRKRVANEENSVKKEDSAGKTDIRSFFKA